MMKTIFIFLTCVLLPILLLAQSSSEDFVLTKSVIDAAGGRAASESFQSINATGQSTPIGQQISESFTLHAGFLTPTLAVSPLSPIQELVILPQNPHVWLYWEQSPEAQSYVVYRDTTALFIPSPSNYLASTIDTVFVDVNAIAGPATKRFYLVTTSSESPRHNAIGK